MYKFIFDEFGVYSGQDRETMNSELEIYLNEFPTDLTKTIEDYETRIRKDEHGNDLYVITEKGFFEEVDGRVMTTVETDDPVYDRTYERHPILDANGNHRYVVDTVKQLTTTKTNEPTLDPTGDQMKDDAGKLLYYQEVEVSEREYLYETEVVNIHRRDGKGNPLFWTNGTVINYNPEGVTETFITRNDERWTPDTPIATYQEAFMVTRSFADNPFQFTYEELRAYKRDSLLNKTFALEAFLMEDYNEQYFETHSNVDISRNTIRINPGGTIETKPFTFRQPGNYFKIFPEVSNAGLSFKAISMENGIRVERPFSSLNELITTTPIQTLAIYTENKGENPVVVDSIGIIS